MNKDLYQYFKTEYEKPFVGWDFKMINDQMITEVLNWDYQKLVKAKLNKVKTLLDIDTGGGEVLKGFQPLPKNTYATEAYKPNVPIAKENLEPLGVKVVEMKETEYDSLPFEDDFYDLIINRHGSYDARELYRILKNGGQFITQQVGGLNNLDLNHAFGSQSYGFDDWNLNYAVDKLEKVGFKIIFKEEQKPLTKFNDTGAILYYLKAIPWQVPEFSIEKYYNEIIKIHRIIEDKGYFEVKAHRFVIVAEK